MSQPTNTTPHATVERLVASLQNGDVETALSLYEPTGALVSDAGVLSQGQTALREQLTALAGIAPKFESEAQRVIEIGDLALYLSRWRARGTAPDGSAIEMHGESSDVLR